MMIQDFSTLKQGQRYNCTTDEIVFLRNEIREPMSNIRRRENQSQKKRPLTGPRVHRPDYIQCRLWPTSVCDLISAIAKHGKISEGRRRSGLRKWFAMAVGSEEFQIGG